MPGFWREEAISQVIGTKEAAFTQRLAASGKERRRSDTGDGRDSPHACYRRRRVFLYDPDTRLGTFCTVKEGL